MERLLCVAAGSLTGGLARWLLGEAADGLAGRGFPCGTLLVNLSGCLLLGLFHGLGETRLALSPQARLLLMAGFCGAFTTFSTWVLEADGLASSGRPGTALAYLAASVLAGFLLFRAGTALAEAL